MSSQIEERTSIDARSGGGGYTYRDSSQQNAPDSAVQPPHANPNIPRQRPLGPVVEDEKSYIASRIKSPVEGSSDRDLDRTKDLAVREKPRTNGNTGGKPTTSRTCKKCGEPLTGQFVRALGGTFHLDCFKCQVSRMKFAPNLRLLIWLLLE